MALIWPTIMRDAIDWIWKLTEVLSVNYLDRFLIVYELHKGEAWTMHLFALACLFQASNMEETYMSLLYMKIEWLTPISARGCVSPDVPACAALAGDHGGGGGRHDVAANRQEDQDMIQEEAQEVMEAVGLATGTT
ncbi:uncharacterized protein [Lolium perenne]|uniref:uncharacterized protein isoform X2 n=1 Tax=Lolium perenne TaxID=4522 RepID=UPI0021F6119C|nr:uncharacterized protein LOC127306689 isoform X2 [Lolium perenne]